MVTGRNWLRAPDLAVDTNLDPDSDSPPAVVGRRPEFPRLLSGLRVFSLAFSLLASFVSFPGTHGPVSPLPYARQSSNCHATELDMGRIISRKSSGCQSLLSTRHRMRHSTQGTGVQNAYE